MSSSVFSGLGPVVWIAELIVKTLPYTEESVNAVVVYIIKHLFYSLSSYMTDSQLSSVISSYTTRVSRITVNNTNHNSIDRWASGQIDYESHFHTWLGWKPEPLSDSDSSNVWWLWVWVGHMYCDVQRMADDFEFILPWKYQSVERKPPDILSDLSEAEIYCLSDTSELVSDQTVALSDAFSTHVNQNAP
jgi:hypothetical protein